MLGGVSRRQGERSTDGQREHAIPLDQVATARLVFEFGPAPKPGKHKKYSNAE